MFGASSELASVMEFGLYYATRTLRSTAHLHHVGDGLAFGQYLGQVLGAEHVAQGGLREKAGRVVRVLDVRDRHGGVADPVVDDRIDRHRHGVLRQHLPTTDRRRTNT